METEVIVPEITPDVLRLAMARLDEFGLLQTGPYVDEHGQRACTIGHAALAAGMPLRTLYGYATEATPLYKFSQRMDHLFSLWWSASRARPNKVAVTYWSDAYATATAVRGFYQWCVEQLETTNVNVTMEENEEGTLVNA